MALSPDGAAQKRRVDEIVSSVQSVWGKRPTLGIILGTGMGRLADDLKADVTIPYERLPHFPASIGESHTGRLLAGVFEGLPTIVFHGRFHLYEGYDAKEVALPVRVLAGLGARYLFVSNAAGGLNPYFRRGDLMVVTDHINLQGDNPLVGPNLDEWGPRFPDMSEPYDQALCQIAEEVALESRIPIRQGIYAAMCGPNLETRAEYRFLRLIGADAVGMSTVPEVIVARHAGLRVLTLSVIAYECRPDALESIALPELQAAVASADPRVTSIFSGVARRIED